MESKKIYNRATKTENFYHEMRWKFTIASTTVALVTIIITVATAITTHVTHMIFRHFDYWLFSVEDVVKVHIF